jgi:hypothetical protein
VYPTAIKIAAGRSITKAYQPDYQWISAELTRLGFGRLIPATGDGAKIF